MLCLVTLSVTLNIAGHCASTHLMWSMTAEKEHVLINLLFELRQFFSFCYCHSFGPKHDHVVQQRPRRGQDTSDFLDGFICVYIVVLGKPVPSDDPVVSCNDLCIALLFSMQVLSSTGRCLLI